jgi:hypothetical protein
MFLGKLEATRKSSAFILAEQDRVATVDMSTLVDTRQVIEHVLYDYEFAVFFKDCCGMS